MLRAIPVILALVLAVYSVVDVVQAERHVLRPLGRIGWLAVVLLIPILGPLVWIFMGGLRERAAPAGPAGPTGYSREPRVLAPEDDPEFLRQMQELDTAHEQLLKQWEDDLRRREQGLRKDDEEPPETGGSPAK